MFSLVGKVALVAAMAIGTYFMGDSIAAPVGSSNPCTKGYGFDCCVYICMHDSSTGCNGGGACCERVCR